MRTTEAGALINNLQIVLKFDESKVRSDALRRLIERLNRALTLKFREIVRRAFKIGRIHSVHDFRKLHDEAKFRPICTPDPALGGKEHRYSVPDKVFDAFQNALRAHDREAIERVVRQFKRAQPWFNHLEFRTLLSWEKLMLMTDEKAAHFLETFGGRVTTDAYKKCRQRLGLFLVFGRRGQRPLIGVPDKSEKLTLNRAHGTMAGARKRKVARPRPGAKRRGARRLSS